MLTCAFDADRHHDCREAATLDTKYSTTTLAATLLGGEKFKSENLYQLYAYLRTQEQESDAHRGAQGMLLYPTTSQELNETMSVQGHRMYIATVDLSKEWETIEARLRALVNSAYELGICRPLGT